jgi:uncharacterized protein (DUF1697 family)
MSLKEQNMTKYIAFLRGINVGNIRIKMTDLKTAFENRGFKEVKTYLQTGNVVFESEKNLLDIKPVLEKGLSETFHYEAYVLLYEFDVLNAIIDQCPFESEENHHAYIIFVEKETVLDELIQLSENIGEESKVIKRGNQVIYWKVKIGDTLHTTFAKIIAKAKYKKFVTTRNLNTLEKMVFSLESTT